MSVNLIYKFLEVNKSKAIMKFIWCKVCIYFFADRLEYFRMYKKSSHYLMAQILRFNKNKDAKNYGFWVTEFKKKPSPCVAAENTRFNNKKKFFFYYC